MYLIKLANPNGPGAIFSFPREQLLSGYKFKGTLTKNIKNF